MIELKKAIIVDIVLVAIIVATSRVEDPAPVPVPEHPNFLASLPIEYQGSPYDAVNLNSEDLSLLHPDAYTIRNYRLTNGDQVQLAVIAGRDKQSLHTPTFCMIGSGWDLLVQRRAVIAIAASRIPVVESVFIGSGDREHVTTKLLMTYFFTDGFDNEVDLLRFQWRQIINRFHGDRRIAAMVRITVPFSGSESEAQARTVDFARSVVPPVLRSLRSVS